MNAQLTPVEGLMLRAALYQLLAHGFAYPGPAQRRQVLEMAAELSPWAGMIDPRWADRLGQLAQSLEAAEHETVEAEFNRLFSGAMAVAPYETAYERDIFRKQNALADIAGFYRAFGFAVVEASRWQPDHVGVQLEYCAILLQRTAQAVEQNWEEQTAICVDAFRKFLAEHLGRWSDAFAADVDRAAALPFYRLMAELTREWLALEMQVLEVEPDRLSSRHVAADDGEAPTCGGCTGCGPEGPPAGVQSCPSTPSL